MEQRGIKTSRGDFNREVKADNVAMKKDIDIILQAQESIKETQRIQQEKLNQLQAEYEKKEAELKKREEQEKKNSEREKTKIIAQDQAHDVVFRPRERDLSTTKPSATETNRPAATPQHPEKLGAELGRLKSQYIQQSQAIENARNQHTIHTREIARIHKQKDNITRDTKEISEKEKQIEKLQQKRKELGILDGKEKKNIDSQINAVSRAKEQAENHFKREYGITREQATAKIQELDGQIRETEKQAARLPSTAQIRAQQEILTITEMEYKKLKIQADTRSEPDRKIIENTEEKHVRQDRQPDHDMSRYRAETKLNNITREEYQKLKKEISPDIRKNLENRDKAMTGKDALSYTKGGEREAQSLINR